MSPVDINTKSVVIAALCGVILLYAIYMRFPAKSKAVQLKLHTSWKTAEFVDIPSNVVHQAKQVKVEERHLKFSIDGQVSLLCCNAFYVAVC